MGFLGAYLALDQLAGTQLKGLLDKVLPSVMIQYVGPSVALLYLFVVVLARVFAWLAMLAATRHSWIYLSETDAVFVQQSLHTRAAAQLQTALDAAGIRYSDPIAQNIIARYRHAFQRHT
jgi:hypothetical protein